MFQDRNFDDLIERFEQRIYETNKGQQRLTVLKQDIRQVLSKSWSIWDAGCGFAQTSLWLASEGHQLWLCDLSEKILTRAQQNFAEKGLQATFFHSSVQQLAPELPTFDLVLFHAVLEWLAEPLPTLMVVLDKVRVGGYISLLFYNRNAMVFTNVLKGRWRLKPILQDSYLGKGNKLTPPNPQYPHEVISLLKQEGFDVEIQTGIRVFSDYMTEDVSQGTDKKELTLLEERYCRMPTYRDMGRYVHVLAKRSSVVKKV